jgi:hypothetical protein
MSSASQVTIADVMRAFAREAEQLAHSELGLALDYSESSLRVVDRLMQARLSNGLVVPESLTKEQEAEHWEFCKKIGGYLGEVIIRNNGGYWVTQTEANGAMTIHLLVAGLVSAHPPDSVWRCLTEPNRGSVVALYETLLATLAIGRDEVNVVNGIKEVRIRPLNEGVSGNAATEVEPPTQKPWWKLW